MISDYSVSVTYKNSQLDQVRTRTYRFDEYCNDLRNNVLAAIGEVELAMGVAQGDPDKSKWSESSMEHFKKVRHKLLDVANNVSRLPTNTCYRGERIANIKLADFIANTLK